jgi:putative flippase GtrA
VTSTSKPLTRAASRELQRFIKFLVVGGVGFVVDTGSLTALVFLFSADRRLA